MKALGVRSVKLPGDPNVSQITWSPDGLRLLFHFTNRADGVMVVDRNGFHPIRLAYPAADRAAWSPDGESVAVRFTPRIDADGIYVYSFVKDQLRALYLQPNLGSFAWSPFGDQLAVVDQYQKLLLIDAITGDVATTLAEEIGFPTIRWLSSTAEVTCVTSDRRLIVLSPRGHLQEFLCYVDDHIWSEHDDLAVLTSDHQHDQHWLVLKRKGQHSRRFMVRNAKLSFVGDGSRLYVAGEVRTDFYWHQGLYWIDEENKVHTLFRDDEFSVIDCAISPDGEVLAIIDKLHRLHLYNL